MPSFHLSPFIKLLRSKLGCLYFVDIGISFSSPLLYWFGVFFSPEVELRVGSLMTFWAEYKVVLVALSVAACVLPQLLLLFDEHDSHLFRSSFRPASIDGCSQRASCVSCGQAYRWKALCFDLCFVCFIKLIWFFIVFVAGWLHVIREMFDR